MRPPRILPALVAGAVLLGAAQIVAIAAAPRREAAELGALPPGEFAGTLMLGGFRGLACDLLWLRASSAKEQGRHYESVALAEAITRVQPKFADVWQHLAHDLAYNIAFAADGADARYAWFSAGAEANLRGIERNPGEERLVRHLAWMFNHRGDQFHRQIEAADWAARLAPALAAVRRHLDLAEPAAAPAPPRSNFAIAHELYTLCAEMAARRPASVRTPSFVRRMAAHALDADGNRLRNRGEHLAAVRRWLDAAEAWRAVQAWLDGLADDAAGREARYWTSEVMQRSEGRLRRKAADLARLLAPTPDDGEAAALAIVERRLDAARALLSAPGWLASAGSAAPGVSWLDE